MKSKDISSALSMLLDTAYHAISNLDASKKEAEEFLVSGTYSDSEYAHVVEDLDNEIQHIKNAADIVLDFKIILNRHTRVSNAISEINEDIAKIFSFDS